MHAVTTQIPDARQHLIRYQGAYANTARALYRPARGEEPRGREQTSVSAEEDGFVSTGEAQRRRSWARLLRRIYEVDPLRCRCGGELRIVSVITDPVVVDRILEHWTARQVESPLAARAPPAV